MSKSNDWEHDLLSAYFNGTAIANLLDNAAVAPLTVLYVSLHHADPGETGKQNTQEVNYTGYARVAVARNGTGWVVAGNVVNPAADIVFPTCAGGSDLATHFGIGRDASGPGTLDYSGSLSPAIPIMNTVVPKVLSTSSITED